MRHIEQIDDPTWQDIFDRESAIRKLQQEVDELQHDLQESSKLIEDLKARVKWQTALLGVP